jgi:hypothetical protein
LTLENPSTLAFCDLAETAGVHVHQIAVYNERDFEIGEIFQEVFAAL